MHSEKLDQVNRDEPASPVSEDAAASENEAALNNRAGEATASPEQDETSALVSRPRLSQQSPDDTGSSPDSNGAQSPVDHQPHESMFRRPSAIPAAEAIAPTPHAVPDRPEPANLAGQPDSQPHPLVSPATEPMPAEQTDAARHSTPPVSRVTHIEPSVRPSMPQVSPDRPARVPVAAGPEKPKGLLDLAPGEQLVREVDSGDDGRFVLTTIRLIYQGRSAEGAIFAAAAVADVTSIEFRRRARDSRSVWWGVIGMIAAILVWQVTINEGVGAVAGAVVAGISALLLADYWFRPPGLVLRFGTAGGAVQGAVSGKRVREAEELAAEVQRLRHLGGGATGTASARGSGRPPGGSPGLF